MAMPDDGFLDHCVFICVDLQEGEKGEPMTLDTMPRAWRDCGYEVDDVNAATDHSWDVCLPNACRVADACRELKLPMVFLHWGYQFKDGMDLDPIIRKVMLGHHGEDYGKWPGHAGQPGSRPSRQLNVRDGEYVLAKTAQNAFISSNLGFVLANLEVRNLIFLGGNTEACLGKTAATAKRRGYRTLCVEDATNNARESTRMKGIEDAQFDYVVRTEDFLALKQAALARRT